MSALVRRVEYFRIEVEDHPGQAYLLFSHLAGRNISLLSVSAIPIGPTHTQFVLIPDSSERLVEAADRLGLSLVGPYPALLIQGDDQVGALLEFHQRLADAKINVYATSGVSDGSGRFGYVVHVRPEDFERASLVLDAQ